MSGKKYDASKVQVKINGQVIEGIDAEWELVEHEPVSFPLVDGDGPVPVYSGSATWTEAGEANMRMVMAAVQYVRWIGEWVTAWDLIGMEVYQRALNSTADPCWAVLGIPPGSSEREIKRAYARLVRQHPPERDAEGFQRVRLAYEEALAPPAEEHIEIQPFADFMHPDTASGEWLDRWGEMIGGDRLKRRPGETDADYRQRVVEALSNPG